MAAIPLGFSKKPYVHGSLLPFASTAADLFQCENMLPNVFLWVNVRLDNRQPWDTTSCHRSSDIKNWIKNHSYRVFCISVFNKETGTDGITTGTFNANMEYICLGTRQGTYTE